MIKLPKGAFTVVREEPEKKSSIIGVEVEKINRGTIMFTSEELNQYQGWVCVFREAFAETIKINGIEVLYFRDFDSSIYYVKKD